MERKPNESFEAYKARRAAADKAAKLINLQTRRGGSQSTRELLRSEQRGGGVYGKNLMAHFARLRITPKLTAAHMAHVDRMAARKATRAANDDAAIVA